MALGMALGGGEGSLVCVICGCGKEGRFWRGRFWQERWGGRGDVYGSGRLGKGGAREQASVTHHREKRS